MPDANGKYTLIGLFSGLLMNFAATVWFVSAMNQRLQYVENWVQENRSIEHRITTVESEMSSVCRRLGNIEAVLTGLDTKLDNFIVTFYRHENDQRQERNTKQ